MLILQPNPGCIRVRRFLELVEANTAGLTEMIDIAASGQEPLSRNTSETPLPDETDDDQLGQLPVVLLTRQQLLGQIAAFQDRIDA